MVDSYEKISVEIYPTAKEGSAYVAREIATLIRHKQALNEPCVLGLATGSTPISLYAELVRMHKEERLSFKNVISFNLDEYYPIEQDAFQSYWSFMHRHLFSHVDIIPENINLPSGNGSKDDVKLFFFFVRNTKIRLKQLVVLTYKFLGLVETDILDSMNQDLASFQKPGW